MLANWKVQRITSCSCDRLLFRKQTGMLTISCLCCAWDTGKFSMGMNQPCWHAVFLSQKGRFSYFLTTDYCKFWDELTSWTVSCLQTSTWPRRNSRSFTIPFQCEIMYVDLKDLLIQWERETHSSLESTCCTHSRNWRPRDNYELFPQHICQAIW